MSQDSSDAARPIAVLASACVATNVIVNALREAGIGTTVIIEKPVPVWQLAFRRAKRLGVGTVCGQVLFRSFAVPVLEWRARTRIREIARAFALDITEVTPDLRIDSVNDDEARQALIELNPAAVVLVGTRIVSPATLCCVEVPFLNLHAGITPRYRGVHGGYWALTEGRPDLAGSTLHLVDPGIDTGPVLGQVRIPITERDTFATYPFLHLAAGAPLLVEAVHKVQAGESLIACCPFACGPSRLWYHPTLVAYVRNRVRNQVR